MRAGAVAPGHCTMHCALGSQLTLHSSLQTTVQVELAWQLALPSPTVIWQVAPVSQVAVHDSPQLPAQVCPAGQDGLQAAGAAGQGVPDHGQVAGAHRLSPAAASSRPPVAPSSLPPAK